MNPRLVIHVVRVLRLGAAILSLVLSGCGGSSQRRPPASGSPEADRRAEMRVGSEETSGSETAADAPLYVRLGGRPVIIDIVEDSTARIIADPRVNFSRDNVSKNWFGGKVTPWKATPENVDRFKTHMVEFLTLATGGPAQYGGRDLGVVHKGMKITNDEFDAAVGDIKASMDRLSIGPNEQRDLLAIVETTRKQIVEKL
ncbi:MAG TPA: group 1 truncated hemoglobin [Phycisphaerales bacterium]